jgi:glycosyltransferase involved in cell wall biosynthesis
MTILGVFLNNQLRTGGNRRYLELMEQLALRGGRVLVIMNRYLDYEPEHFRKITLSVKYRRRGFPPASFLFRREIKKHLEEIAAALGETPDFIHIHGDTHLKAALFLRDKFRAPLFYAFRANDIDRAHIMRRGGGLSPKEYVLSCLVEPVNRRREQVIAKKATLITFQNTHDRDRFLKRTRCDPGKTVIIPGNIGLPRFTPEWEKINTSDSVRNLLYIGSLSATKGLWELLGALDLLRKRGFGFLRCKILGRMEQYESTLRRIGDLGIGEMVSLEGFQDPFPYLRDCDLMVYPTRYDAFPDAVLEALHTGCPVIASAVGGIPDMLFYGELLFDSGDVDQMAGRIERCIKDPAFYRRIRGFCAERAALYRFDWAERFEEAMRRSR